MTPSAKERATRAIYAAIDASLPVSAYDIGTSVLARPRAIPAGIDELVAAVASALEDARRDALEEAATIADRAAAECDGLDMSPSANAIEVVAAAIRAPAKEGPSDG